MWRYFKTLMPYLVLSSLISPSSCDNLNSPGIPPISFDLLMSAPDTIEVSGHNFVLETNLWRDFMPISPPDGKPLTALVRLVEIDSNSIDGDFDVDFIWVINKNLVWSSTFLNSPRPPHPDYVIERLAKGGPKWGPGIEVDVVVSVSNGSSPLMLLAARDQGIGKSI